MTPIVFDLIVRTKNPNNQSFGNSRAAALAQARTDRTQRELARVHTIAAMRRARVHAADLVPAHVRLVRVSSGHLDEHDGLGPALKRIIDGIALALGVDDGGPFVTWELGQQKAPPRVHGVRVRIERRS